MGHIGRESDLSGLTRDDGIEMIPVLGGESVQTDSLAFKSSLENMAIGKLGFRDIGKFVFGDKDA